MHLKKIAMGLGAICLAGCANVSKNDLDNVEAKLEADISKAVAELQQKINATDAKYAHMLTLEQSVKTGVDKIDENAKLLQSSGKAYLELLQIQRNVLKEQLKSTEDQLESLSKK